MSIFYHNVPSQLQEEARHRDTCRAQRDHNRKARGAFATKYLDPFWMVHPANGDVYLLWRSTNGLYGVARRLSRFDSEGWLSKDEFDRIHNSYVDQGFTYLEQS